MKTKLFLETLESKRTLSSVSVVSTPLPHPARLAAVQVPVQQRVQQSRPVLNAPRFVGMYQGGGSLAGISVSGGERTTPFLVIAAGRGGTITSTIRDPGVCVRMTTNAVGGTVFYIGGSPAAINRNMKFLTYRGPESPIRVQLYVCNVTSCTKFSDVTIPVRRFQ